MAKLDTTDLEKYFKEDIDFIKKEMDEADNLYNELKYHFDKVKKSSSNGALTFISKQTPNLISAKNNKISLMKDLVSIKKIMIDTSMKQSNDENTSLDDKIMEAVHNILVNNNRNDYIDVLSSNVEKNEEEKQEQTIDYDLLLEERMREIECKKVIDDNENNFFKYVVDLNKNIYAVDEEYNEIPSQKIPEDWSIEIHEENGERIAINQNGEILEVVDIE